VDARCELVLYGGADADTRPAVREVSSTAATSGGQQAHPGSGEATIWERWRTVWHGFFYLLLAYATIEATTGASQSAASKAVRLSLAAALGAWYWAFLVTRPRTPRRDLVYLVGAVGLWAPLIALDPVFLTLGFGVLAPFCLHDLRHGAAVVLVVAVGWIWQLSRERGGVPWPAVAAVCVFAAGTLLSVAYMSTVVRQSRERQRLIEQLQATRAELAAAERQAGTLAERQRLARDLHDTLTQGFASIVLLLEAAEESLTSGRPIDRHIHQALRAARDNLAESRRVVWALRPRPLAEQPLPQALGELTGRLAEETGLQAETVVTGTARPLSSQVEEALLRVGQEALANVRKHAAASRVTITLSYLEDAVTLDVHDDGVGFEQAAATAGGGLGLHAMGERVAALGGSLVIESAPSEGATIAVELPDRADENQPEPTGRETR
jgi:signal transduction histidine kinase